MRRILIGHDGSARGDDALALGRLLATLQPDAELHLATVYDQLVPRSGPDDERPAQRRVREAAEALLDRVRADRWPQLGDEALHAVCAKAPADGLHELAETLDADVIVVGASARGGLGRIWPGSTTERILHRAPCAVAVAPPGFAEARAGVRLERVAVAFNGSTEARDALATAASLARATRAELALVAVVDPRPLAPAVRDYAGQVRALHEQAETALEEGATAVGDGVEPIRQVREGDPVDELVALTREVDLLVLGTRNRGPLGRLLLGNVSGPVVRAAASPVLVVPRTTARSGEEAAADAGPRKRALNRILIGYDGSSRGDDALALGRALARLVADPQVVVTTVHPALIPKSSKGEPTARELELRDEAARVLERARDRWAEPPPAAFEPTRASSPASGLHRLAREREMELIVVGASQRQGLGRIWHGSATEQTLQGSPRPVAVAPPDYAAARGADPRLERIGLAYDGTREADHALELVGELVAGSDATVVVVDVVETAFTSVAAAYSEALLGDELRERADADLARAEATLRDLGAARVERQRREGTPADELIAASEQLDLLVLGSRSHGPALRLLLGTVSSRVVRGAHCPVLVFPRSAATELELVYGQVPRSAASR